jgi:hypothetical protein
MTLYVRGYFVGSIMGAMGIDMTRRECALGGGLAPPASFFYLKELPMEYVKIDGSSVRNLLERPDDQALVWAMAQIARAFGKKTVAEHVSPARSWSSPGGSSTSIMPRATTPAARYP